MASQVLSGASNPTYTNNTGQNVRVVINYMQGVPTVRPGERQEPSGTISIPGVPGFLTLNWAGVSVTAPLAAIGRNLAVATYLVENISPFSQTVNNTLGVTVASTFSGKVAFSNNNALAVSGLNPDPISSGFLGQFGNIGARTSAEGALPTELILAPGQTFSAICRVYNIVIIPEAG